MLPTLLALALTLMFGVADSDTLPLDVNVAMSAPVSALTTVNDVTDWAAAQFGTTQIAVSSAERRRR